MRYDGRDHAANNRNLKAPQVKEFSPRLRASHVNAGTSVPRQQLSWSNRPRPVHRHPPVRVKQGTRRGLSLGGLALAAVLAQRSSLAAIS